MENTQTLHKTEDGEKKKGSREEEKMRNHERRVEGRKKERKEREKKGKKEKRKEKDKCLKTYFKINK